MLNHFSEQTTFGSQGVLIESIERFWRYHDLLLRPACCVPCSELACHEPVEWSKGAF